MTMLALPWLREDKNKVTLKMIDFDFLTLLELSGPTVTY